MTAGAQYWMGFRTSAPARIPAVATGISCKRAGSAWQQCYGEHLGALVVEPLPQVQHAGVPSCLVRGRAALCRLCGHVELRP